MKYKFLNHTTCMNPVETYEGEFIEEKVARVVENREPIEDGAPIIYTERKDGVIPAYNIRADKWDIALTAMDQVNKNWEAKNMEKPGTFAEDVPEKTDEELKVGDYIFDRNGKVTSILAKSEIFNKPMYELVLADGRKLKVSEDHINIVRKRTSVPYSSKLEFKEFELTTKELLEKGVTYNRTVSERNRVS